MLHLNMSILCHRRSNRFSMFPKKTWFRQRLNVRPKPSQNANGGDGVPRGLECARECILIIAWLELFKNDQKLIRQSSYFLEYSIRTWNHDSDTWMTRNHWSNEWLASAIHLFWVANIWRNLWRNPTSAIRHPPATRYNERQVIFTDLGEAVHAGAGMPDRKQQQDRNAWGGHWKWDILWQLDANKTHWKWEP